MKLIDYVNIKQGTESTFRFSNGNTLPLVQVPFGFASFAPQTDSMRGGWFYHPHDRSFEGVRLTRQPSPWIEEQGAIAIFAQYGEILNDVKVRWSSFRPEDTVLKPHYMKYDILRARATMELTPTNSGACIRFNFRDDMLGDYISVHPVGTLCAYEVRENMLMGHTECVSVQKKRKNAKVYFVIEFPKGHISEVISQSGGVIGSKKEWSGKDASAHIRLNVKATEIRISTSLISNEQALLNLRCEHTYSCFDELMEINESIWEEHLSRISIGNTDSEIMKTFYSCLYRAFLYPHKAYELDSDGNPVHYSSGTDQVEKGYRYTDNGFWDTYRTVYSLLPLIAPDEYEKMIQSYINDYKEDGWLPRWMATEPKDCMPSTMIDPVLTDAAKRGVLKGELLETALEAMMKHANQKSDSPEFGRMGCLDYLKLGYVPNSFKGNVNLTLDAAYGDWCISEIAGMLGKNDIRDEYFRRSKNYKNIFDPEYGFMRSRDKEGNMSDTFIAEQWGWDYTEASAWQTSFAVQHDFDGLAALHGGRGKLLEKLDALFAEPPIYYTGTYQRETHEMSEMAAADFGQCAISNQPSFHLPFIYAYFGETEKTEHWIKRICSEAFSSGDDGFPGDEDNGTMACWYLFAAMGFYPLTPGKNEYVHFKGICNDVRICGKNINEII